MDAPLEDYGDQSHPIAVVRSILSVGAVTGAGGLLFGSATGIIRSPNPVIFATAAGLQWFALGTTFWGARTVLLMNVWDYEEIGPRQRTYASGLAGALSGGTVTALTRGRNIIPGTIFSGILGTVGQAAYNNFDASRTASISSPNAQPSRSVLQVLASKDWIPMKALSDAEYRDMLHEKLLRIEAEIAVIDDDIEKIRKEEKGQLAANLNPDQENWSSK